MVGKNWCLNKYFSEFLGLLPQTSKKCINFFQVHIDRIGVLSDELKYYAKVAATNMVTCKILTSDKISKNVIAEYGSKLTPFPILKLA